MNHFFHVFVVVLTILFVLGCVGCLLVIPSVAGKFIAVLFEKDKQPEPKAGKDSAEI